MGLSLRSSYLKSCLRSVALAFGIGALAFAVCSTVVGGVIRSGAETALRERCEDSAESTTRPLIPVYELDVSLEETYPGNYFFDVFINSSYCANPAAQQEDALDTKVFHASNLYYDGYYLPTEKGQYGIRALYFVDTTYVRFVGLISCLVSCALLALTVSLLGIRGERYAKRRDRLDESLEIAFANASHELKTPLMAIRGYSEGLQCGAVDKEFACERIVVASERMAETIDGILKISQIDSGLRKPILGKWDVREIVYDEARMVEEECRKRNVHLDIRLPRPLYRYCDAPMLSAVIINVLSNASRHAETFIRVSEGRLLQGSLELFVDNDGPPPSEEALAHAFDRFYRGENGSTGIGLALSHEYVELMGGEIDMLSMDWGVRIRIRL